MLNKLRESLASLLEIITQPLQSLPPDLITLLGLLASLTAAVFYLQATSASILIGALYLVLSGYFDVADGFIAKKKRATTKFGALLDSVADRYSDAIIVGALIVGGLADPLIGIAALAGFFLVSYVRARAEALGVMMVTIGLAERAERLLILIGASIVAALTSPKTVMNLAVIVLAILTHFTVVQRMVYARSKLS